MPRNLLKNKNISKFKVVTSVTVDYAFKSTDSFLPLFLQHCPLIFAIARNVDERECGGILKLSSRMLV